MWHNVFLVEVLEDSVLSVNRTLARLVSILLMSLPLPSFVADCQELDFHLSGEIGRPLLVRVDALAFTRCNCVLHCFLPKC